MENFWDTRYQVSEYIYGTAPNEYLAEKLPEAGEDSKILLPFEGEGRNALFTAKNGWDTYAFDGSVKGKEKALKLCKEYGVEINYEISMLEEFDFRKEFFDIAALIFAHADPNGKKLLIEGTLSSIKPGGYIIMEVFSKNQLGRTSGGPQHPDLLYTVSELHGYLSEFKVIELEMREKMMREGSHHEGISSVINVFARKK